MPVRKTLARKKPVRKKPPNKVDRGPFHERIGLLTNGTDRQRRFVPLRVS